MFSEMLMSVMVTKSNMLDVFSFMLFSLYALEFLFGILPNLIFSSFNELGVFKRFQTFSAPCSEV